jgi:hypothetical protein
LQVKIHSHRSHHQCGQLLFLGALVIAMLDEETASPTFTIHTRRLTSALSPWLGRSSHHSLSPPASRPHSNASA